MSIVLPKYVVHVMPRKWQTMIVMFLGICVLPRLVMGPWCGDLDPAIPLYMQNTLNMSTSELDV
jgi:hypothetical protein